MDEFQLSHIETDIKRYRTVQTGPKMLLGGLKVGLLRVLYQPLISGSVAHESKSPIKIVSEIRKPKVERPPRLVDAFIGAVCAEMRTSQGQL